MLITRRKSHPDSSFSTRSGTPVAPVQFESLESRRLLNGGGLDSSFGAAGQLTNASLPAAAKVAVQSDGKIVVAGTLNQSFVVSRFNYDGTIDTTFGTRGTATTLIGTADTVGALAIDSRGRIVVAGTASGIAATSNFALLRYTTAGRLDRHFNRSGFITTSFGGNDAANAVAISSTGTIYVAGSKLQDNGLHDFALARYGSAGQLDRSFGSGGEIVTDLGSDDIATSIAVRGDQIIAAGTSSGVGSSFAVARYTGAGQLDSSFNGLGFKVLQLGFADTGAGVVIQADKKVVVGGTADGVGTLFRFTSAGLPDSSYGANGRADFNDNATNDPLNTTGVNDLTLQNDGKVLTAGFLTRNGSTTFALARFNSTGQLDSTFGTVTPPLAKPLVTTSFPDNSGATSVALSPDGKIVAAGGASSLDLARYNNNATGPDATQPTARLNPISRLRRATARPVTFTVTYSDNVAVNVDTLGNGDVRVDGPNGFGAKASFIRAVPGKNAASVVATYAIAAPPGGFTSVFNGVYTVSVRRHEVRDTNGNFLPAGVLGSFTVKVPALT